MAKRFVTREEIEASRPGILEYYTALGRFVSKFADIETSVQGVLWHCAGIHGATAKALFSGVRVEAGLSYISRICAAEKWPKASKDRFQRISTQLGHLRRLRNDILHYGARYKNAEKLIVSNVIFAHLSENIVETAISPKILDAATADLDTLEICLYALRYTYPADEQELYDEALKRAWRYRPPQRAGAREKHPGKPPKSRDRRKSSRQ